MAFSAADYSMLGGTISGVGSAYSTYSAGISAGGAYDVSADQSERMAEYAVQEAEVNNMKLQRLFNDTQATQAATFAAQGRSFSSGSIQNIIASDQADLEWDMAYNMATATQQAEDYMEDAEGFKDAASSAESSGKTSAGVSLLGTAVSAIGSFF